jgi:hypothetical protein
MKLFILIIFFFLLSTIVQTNTSFGQTDTLNIYWDANSEPNMKEYRLRRSVNGGSSQLIETIPHPNTHFVDRDTDAIRPGNLIKYDLIAVDSSELQSEPSLPDSAGIPIILETNLAIESNKPENFPLYPSIVSDQDHDIDDLHVQTLSIPADLQITFNDDSSMMSLRSDLASGTLNFILKVWDIEGFWDQKQINVSISSPVSYFGESWVLSWSSDHSRMHVSINTTIRSSIVEMKYWIDPNFPNTIESLELSKSHSFDLVNLIPDTTYFYTLILEDSVGYRDTVAVDSTFETGNGATSETTAKVIVFPNPYRPGVDNEHEYIIFENLLPETAEIMIFTTSGVLVYNDYIDENDLQEGRYIWQVVNNDNRELASGLYIYIIKGEGGQKIHSGKLAVIR